MNPFAGKFYVSQTWEQHLKNAGSALGGVDYAGTAGTKQREMPRGTPLLAPSDGVFEWAEPRSKSYPSWYNTGLGYAAAVLRPDGTRTIYGHCSARSVTPGSRVRAGQTIALSGGQAGSEGAGKSTGGHVHVHDVLADGRTRARPFSTITTTNGGGSAGFIPDTKEPTMQLVLRPGQGSDPARSFLLQRRALTSIAEGAELLDLETVQVTDGQLNQLCRIYGIPDGVWPAAMAAIRAGELATAAWSPESGLVRAYDGKVLASSGVAAPSAPVGSTPGGNFKIALSGSAVPA